MEIYTDLCTLMRFNFKNVENQPNSMTRSGSEMPNAIFLSRIQVGIVGTWDVSHRGCDFEFAAALVEINLLNFRANNIQFSHLLAIVTIFVESETIVAQALIRADSVFTLVLAPAVVFRTFINVGQINRRETSFLNSFIRLEL